MITIDVVAAVAQVMMVQAQGAASRRVGLECLSCTPWAVGSMKQVYTVGERMIPEEWLSRR
jgi:hypothetical protein